MKFNIKNLFNKKSLKKLEKATLVGVASLALIVPLAGNVGTSVHADSKSDLEYYESELDDSGASMLTYYDGMYLIMEHPALKYKSAATNVFTNSYYWDDLTWNIYARHFKQLYSPYLYRYMPKHDPFHDASDKRDNRILYRVQKQMGLLGRRSHRYAHRRVHHARHVRRTRRHYSHKRHVNHRNHARRRNTRKHARKRIRYYF